LGWSKKLIGCLILTAGLGNTSFGFQLLKLYGEEGLKTAILVDQPGSFVVLSTLGILVATIYSSGNPWFSNCQKIFLSTVYHFLIACVMNILNFEFLDFLQVVFKTTGSFVTPLALLSVGLQLRFDRKKVSIGTFGIRSFI
jgi:predicted permease